MAALLVCALLAVLPHGTEGDAQAFTSLTDAQGRPITDSRYAQWVSGETLHIETRSDFPSGRVIVERATLKLHPQIEQESWEWTERDGERLVREYTVDSRTGKAVATPPSRASGSSPPSRRCAGRSRPASASSCRRWR